MTMRLHGIEHVRARIAQAATDAGRAPEDITLVAVTKGFDWSEIAPLIREAGITDLGENRAQDLRTKQAEAAADLRWHFIGSLQRNKVRDVAGKVVLIHSIDSERLAEAVGAHAHDLGIRQEILLQVNTSGEATKHGVAPEEAAALGRRMARMEGVQLRGLMTIAAPGDPERARRSFAALRALRDQLAQEDPRITELSMGMSDDLEAAIGEGATMVRVGTAIFGHRPHQD